MTAWRDYRYAGVVDAVDALQEEQATEKVIFVHPKQVTQLRKDAEFTSTDKYPANVRMSGEIGSIAGCRVVPSKKVPLVEVGSAKTKCYACPIIKLEADHDNEDEVPALTIYRKRAVNVETERKPKIRTTEITADEFYVAVLSNEAKVVLVKSGRPCNTAYSMPIRRARCGRCWAKSADNTDVLSSILAPQMPAAAAGAAA